MSIPFCLVIQTQEQVLWSISASVVLLGYTLLSVLVTPQIALVAV